MLTFFISYSIWQLGRCIGLQIHREGYQAGQDEGQKDRQSLDEEESRRYILRPNIASMLLVRTRLIGGYLDSKDGPTDASPTSSPLPKLDDKVAASFPTGKPREEDLLETVICKHCKRPVLKSTAPEHIRGCLKAKQEKARKKKEARDAANRAKVTDGKDEDDLRDILDGEDAMKGQKSAKKSAVKGTTDDSTKKGKKRKADEDDNKEPKKKKKKDEPKAKAAKPKGPVDVEKQCGVTLPNGAQCARSLTCKSHSMGAKRAVPGRSLPYDMLLQQYQKKNQAKQQSEFPTLLTISPVSNNLTNPLSSIQEPQSTPTPLSPKTSTPTDPSTQTKNATPSWQQSPGPPPDPSPNTPSSAQNPNTASSASKNKCYTPWAAEAAPDYSPQTRASPYSAVTFSKPLITA
jgi:hypothetical protein